MWFVISETETRTREVPRGPGDPGTRGTRVERMVIGCCDTEAAAEDLAQSFSRQGITHYVAKASLKVTVSPRTEKL
jgi:hypothetical protein